MNKQEIRRSLEKYSGRPFMNITEIAKCRGHDRKWARELVAGLDYFQEGKSKDYHVGEVADRMMERLHKDSERG